MIKEEDDKKRGQEATAREEIRMEVDPSLAALASAAVFLASCGYSFVVARQKIGTSRCSAAASTHLHSKANVLALRRKHFSSSLSISYANSNPLMIVKVGVARHDGYNHDCTSR
jgi:hypothetical protein